jgi:hypothetical protein
MQGMLKQKKEEKAIGSGSLSQNIKSAWIALQSMQSFTWPSER